MREEEPLTEDLLEGALEALRHRAQVVQRERDIKRGIVEAERHNDMASLLRLKQEKLELDRLALSQRSSFCYFSRSFIPKVVQRSEQPT